VQGLATIHLGIKIPSFLVEYYKCLRRNGQLIYTIPRLICQDEPPLALVSCLLVHAIACSLQNFCLIILIRSIVDKAFLLKQAPRLTLIDGELALMV